MTPSSKIADTHPPSPPDTHPPSLPISKPKNDSSRKFNIVVFGVKECDIGTNRHAHLLHDTKNIASMINTIDSNVLESSIRDCAKLGKYSEDKHRPILVKISRTCQVSFILSLRHKLKETEFSVKADLSKEEREVDKLLLKRRSHLIQSGTSRRSSRSDCMSVMLELVQL